MGRRSRCSSRAWLACLLAGTACQGGEQPRVHLGPPGSAQTHVVVDVRAADGLRAAWRLRSTATVGRRTGTKLLPEEAPSTPLSFPQTYNVVVPDGSGTMLLEVDALSQDGRTVASARGEVDLVPGQGVPLEVTLAARCADDVDCDDGDFCNGPGVCVEGYCQPGALPCPPSPHACVTTTCDQRSRSCGRQLDVTRCPSQTDDEGNAIPAYCDADTGCQLGAPGAPVLVGSPSLDPAVGRSGTVFTLRFSVSEPLAQDPVVLVNTGSRRAPMLLDPDQSRRGQAQFLFTYTASGTESQEGNEVTVDLRDHSGNSVVGLSAGSFRVDLDAPALAAPAVLSPSLLGLGQQATLSVTFTEPLREPPAVDMTSPAQPGAPRAWAVVSGSGAAWTLAFTLGETGLDGTWTLRAGAVDRVGNAAAGLLLGVVELDATPPAVLEEPPPVVSPVLAAPGVTVTVEVRVSEEVQPESLSLVGLAGGGSLDFALVESRARTLQFVRRVSASDEGSHPLLLRGLTDRAGNRQQDVELPVRLAVDAQPPRILSATADRPRYSARDGFNTVTVTVVVSDDAVAASAFLEGVPLDCAPAPGSGTPVTRYLCVYTLHGDEPEGANVVSVVAHDRAGNVSGASVVFLADFTPPALADDQGERSLLLGGGATVSAVLRFSETLLEPPQVHMVPEDDDAGLTALPWAVEPGTGGRWRASYQATGRESEGGWVVLARGTDLAGNTGEEATAATVAVDFTPPSVVEVLVTPPVAAAGRTVKVAIRASEGLLPGRAVLVGMRGLETMAFDAQEAVGAALTFLHTLVPDDEGPWDLRLEGLTDLAGNALPPGVVGHVTGDSTPPSFRDVTPDRPAYGRHAPFDVVVITVTVDGSPVALAARVGGSAMTCQGHDDDVPGRVLYACSHLVTEADPEGVNVVTLLATDAAGNSAAASTTVLMDFTAPSLATGTPDSTYVCAGAVVSMAVQFSDQLRGPPVVRMALQGTVVDETSLAWVDEGDWGGGRYFWFLPQGTEVEGGYVVHASGTDLAGNQSAFIPMGTIWLDYTPPELVQSPGPVVYPERVQVGDDVLAEFRLTEEVRGTLQVSTRGSGHAFQRESISTAPFRFRLNTRGLESSEEEVLLTGLVDLAGNTQEDQSLGWAAWDGDPPVISQLQTNTDRFSRVPPHDVMEVTFVATGYPVRAWMEFASGPVECVESGGGPEASYTCTETFTESTQPSHERLTVYVTDAVGNVATASRAVVLDFDPPQVALGSVMAQYLPSTNNPLRSVTAMRADTVVRVSLSLDETVTGNPSLEIGEHLNAALVSVNGSFCIFDITASAQATTGSFASAVLQSTDTVGNSGTSTFAWPVPGLVVDTVAPPPPQVDTANVVTVDRYPVGTELDRTQALTQVRGNQGAAPDAQVLLVLDGKMGFREVTRAPVDQEGAFTATVPGMDLADPVLVSVDGAGNTSQQVSVRDGRWTSSMPTASYTGGSPHGLRWTRTAAHSPWRVQRADAVLGTTAAEELRISAPDGTRDDIPVRPTWSRVSVASSLGPSVRFYPGAAFDVGRGQAVIHGGDASMSPPFQQLTDTLVLEDGEWRTVATGSPSGNRYVVGMAYDAARGRVVLVSYLLPWTEVWEWDGLAWSKVSRDGQTGPTGGRVAYDKSRGVVAVVDSGGTWSWDGTGWTRDGWGGSPTALAYLESQGSLVAVMNGQFHRFSGGSWSSFGSAPTQLQGGLFEDSRSTQVLFGSDLLSSQTHFRTRWGSWTLDARTRQPEPRVGSSFFGDRAAGAPLLLGGHQTSREVWAYGDQGWGTANQSPGARFGHVMVYMESITAIPPVMRTMVFGGKVDGTCRNDTWEWDGRVWTKANPVSSPPARCGAAAAFDTSTSRVIIFGGETDAGEFLDDTWAWTGNNWQWIQSGGPSPRSYAAAAYLPMQGVVMAGGRGASGALTDTWSYSGGWTTLAAMGTPELDPSASMAYHVDERRLYLLTSQVPPIPPSNPGTLGLYYWSSGWNMVPAVPSGNGGSARLVYDPEGRRLVMFGGLHGTTGVNAFYAFRDSTWTDLAGPGLPPGRALHGMVVDNDRGILILYGGVSGGVALGDVWEYRVAQPREWSGENPLRPAGILTVSVGAVSVDVRDVTGVEVCLDAAWRNTAGTSGSVLGLYWDAWSGAWTIGSGVGSWNVVVSTSSGITPPRRMVVERDAEIHVAVVPSQPGPVTAGMTLMVDRAKATVTYRRGHP